MQTQSLLDTARTLFDTHGKDLPRGDIARQMQHSREWVNRFIAGDIPNPGVLTLEAFIRAIKELTQNNA